MKKINIALIIVSFIGSSFYFFDYLIKGDYYHFLICLSIIPVMLLPIIIKKLFKIKFSSTTEFVYLIFVFCAHFLGSIVQFYYLINNYDKLTHLISGIVTAYFSLLILIRFKKYNNKSIIFNTFFIIAFVLMIASFWEFFEYFSDMIFNKDAQNVLTTGINVTMKDMVSAFLGSCLFCIIYIYDKKIKGNLFIKRLIQENS